MQNALQFDYMVSLEKGKFGLGIYFCDVDGNAHVDPTVPFYRLPSGELAPAEQSRVIKPSDRLVGIGSANVSSLTFQAIVDHIRHLPFGRIELWFQSGHASPIVPAEMMTTFTNDGTCAAATAVATAGLEEEVERERKCKQLLEKKLNSYRTFILELQDANENLQRKLQQVTQSHEKLLKFTDQNMQMLI